MPVLTTKKEPYHQRHANHARQENPLLVDFHVAHLLLPLCINYPYVHMPLQMSGRILCPASVRVRGRIELRVSRVCVAYVVNNTIQEENR